MSEFITSVLLVVATFAMALGLKRFFVNLDKSNNPTAWYDENKEYKIDKNESNINEEEKV